jgi:hypothetical protein
MPSLTLRAIPGSENSPADLTAPAGGEILAVTSLAFVRRALPKLSDNELLDLQRDLAAELHSRHTM